MRTITPSTDLQPAVKSRVVPVVTLLLGAVPFLLYVTYGIDRSLWLDEANTIHIAKGSPAQIMDALSKDVSPPLYYLILSGWMRLFGDTEIAVRMPSVLFYIAGIYVIWRIGRTLLGRDGAWLAAFVYAVSPVAGRQAQNARMYTMLALLTGLSLLVFITIARERDHRTTGWFALFGLIAWIGLNTHYWFAFVLVAYAVWVLCTIRSWSLGELTMLAGFTIVPFAIINLRLFLAQTTLPATTWTPEPGIYTIMLSIGGHLGLVPVSITRSAVSACLLVSPFVFWLAKRKWDSTVASNRTLLFLACIYCITIGLPFLVSLQKPIFRAGRYDTVALPLFALCLAALLLHLPLRPRIVFQVILAASCFTAFYTAVQASHTTGIFDAPDRAPVGDRPAAAAICATAAPGDFVLYTGLSRASVSYYLHHFGCARNLTEVSFPREFEHHMGWQDVARNYSAEPDLRLEAESIAQRAAVSGADIFVLFHPDLRLSGAITEAVERRFRRDSSREFVSCRGCFVEVRRYRPFQPTPVNLRGQRSVGDEFANRVQRTKQTHGTHHLTSGPRR
jgi:uncharacterized membrane protein YhaH (DUF805 family)